MPRPISSNMASDLEVAWLRIPAVSTISTMKVDRPPAMSSDMPMRVKMRSTMPMRADFAGTKLPIWARMVRIAAWRMYVDLPDMLGPVMMSS